MTILLVATLTLAAWFPEGSTFVLAAGIAVQILRKGRSAIALPQALLWPLFALVALGLRGFALHPAYDAIKDVWYFSKPLLELSFGAALLGSISVRRVLRVFVLAGAIASAYYLGNVLLHVDLYMSQDSYSNRVYFGSGSFLSLISLALLTDRPLRAETFRGLSPARSTLFAAGALHVGAMLVSQSRTMLLLLGLLAVLRASLGPFRKRVALFGAAAAALVVYLAITQVQMSAGSRFSDTILDRFSNVAEEVIVGEYKSTEDINAHWRGYESFLALQEFAGFDELQKAIGGGFGQLVQLDRPWSLGTGYLTDIPLLHNGYLYVLIKTGIVGLVMYVFWLFQLLRSLALRASVPFSRERQTLPFWLAWATVLTSFVITGPFNRNDLQPVEIVTGFFVALAVSTDMAKWRLRPPASLVDPHQVNSEFRRDAIVPSDGESSEHLVDAGRLS